MVPFMVGLLVGTGLLLMVIHNCIEARVLYNKCLDDMLNDRKDDASYKHIQMLDRVQQAKGLTALALVAVITGSVVGLVVMWLK